MNKVFFWVVLFGGLLFLLEALVVIQTPEIKWYLIGMGQIMLDVGAVGSALEYKKKKEVNSE